jgi:hypothetical protein
MKHSHDEYLDQFLSLDKGQHLPLSLSLHLLFCKKCIAQVRALTKAEQLAAKPLSISVPVTENAIRTAIKKHAPSLEPKNYRLPIPLWIVAGVFILAALFVFSLLSRNIVNGTLEFTTYMFFALVITGYLVLFFATNIDFFVKRIHTKKAA